MIKKLQQNLAHYVLYGTFEADMQKAEKTVVKWLVWPFLVFVAVYFGYGYVCVVTLWGLP